MDKTTILNTYLNDPSEKNCLKCLEYCYDNNIDFKDSELIKIFDISVRYLMKYKIGNLNVEDAKVLIKYFSNKYITELKLNKSVKSIILTEEEYSSKFDNSSGAICIDRGNMQEIFYSPRIIEKLSSNDISTFFRGMSSIFHEVIHALQNSVIKANKEHVGFIEPKLSLYIMTIETIVRRIDKNFYEKNYHDLYKENHAEQIGMKEAIETIRKYNPKLYELYDIEKINKLIDEYAKAINNSLTVFNYENSHMKAMDAAACLYIQDHPEILDEFPLLKLSYNEKGLKKNIIELIKDRRTKMDNYKNIEDLNKLYNCICNEKNFLAGGLKGTKDEISLLVDYLSKNDYDEFEFELLVQRLNNKQITELQRQAIINYVISCKSESNIELDEHTKNH